MLALQQLGLHVLVVCIKELLTNKLEDSM